MKKSITIASAFAIMGLTTMAAIQWNSVENLAKNATVTVSSNPGAAQTITDDNAGSRWQANAGTHANTADWVLIDLGEKKTFTDIEISWEASHCSSYSVYLPETANIYTEEGDYNLISEEWLNANSPIATGTDDTEANYTANHSFDPVNAQYILIYANSYNGFGNAYGMSIFEVRVANIGNRNAVTALSVSSASAATGVEATITVGGLNSIGEPVALTGVTDLTLSASDPSITINGGENGEFTVSGTKFGTYTLTATAKANGVEISGTGVFSVQFDWTGITNVAVGKKAIGRIIPGLEDPNPIANAVDGNNETYYEYNGAWAGGDSWVMVDLGSEYFVEAIGAMYARGGGRVVLGYSLDDSGLQGYVAENTQWMWNNDNVPEGWNFRTLDRASNAISTVTYSEPVKARYIAVRDADNPDGKPQLCEILVKGEQIQASVASDMEISFDKGGLFVGETASVTVNILDQYGQPFGSAEGAEITVEGADYADGVITATQKGMITVTATAGDAVKTANIMVADIADYCMEGATVTSDQSKSDASTATDGGANPQNHGGLYVVTENESAGEHSHWILADLHKEYNLDMIIAIWEGACPADYDVYVGATEDSLEKLYSVRGHNQNTWYDRFSGKEMNGVRFIKLVTTRNATGYGIKLFDLKAYGTSNIVSVPTEISITASGNNISTDETIEIKAVVLDQFGGTMSDQAIEFVCTPPTATVVNNTFKASETGLYEIMAICGSLTATINVNVVADANDKIAAPAKLVLNGEEQTHNPFNNQETVITELPATLEIEFDSVYNLSLVKLRWEAACPSDYTVVATDDQGTETTVFTVTNRGFQAGFNPVDRIIHMSGAEPGSYRRVSAEGTSNLSKVTKLTIVPTARDHGYNLRLFGVDAYGNADTSAKAEIKTAGNDAVSMFDIQGRCIRRNVSADKASENLPAGLYIINGHKVLVK